MRDAATGMVTAASFLTGRAAPATGVPGTTWGLECGSAEAMGRTPWQTGRGSGPSRVVDRRSAADGVVGEAVAAHRFRVVQVAAVEDDRFGHQPAHHLEVRMAEVLPLGHDGQAVGPLQGAVRPV